jgi:hypothetical protein
MAVPPVILYRRTFLLWDNPGGSPKPPGLVLLKRLVSHSPAHLLAPLYRSQPRLLSLTLLVIIGPVAHGGSNVLSCLVIVWIVREE